MCLYICTCILFKNLSSFLIRYEIPSDDQIEPIVDVDTLEGLENLPDLLYQQKFKPAEGYKVGRQIPILLKQSLSNT